MTRLTTQLQEEARAFQARDLKRVDYVYCWADGVHVNVRLDEERLCLLVLIGVHADGRKELITLAGGYRESEGSWAGLLRDAEKQTFDKAPHHARIILDQSKRMGVLAKGLMDYTRSNVNVEAMDLNGMLATTIESTATLDEPSTAASMVRG